MQITQRQAELCAALADYHRILIMYTLAEKSYNVSQLAAHLHISQPTVSRHLRILRDCGAVSAERQGKSVFYIPADDRIIDAIKLLRSVIADQITAANVELLPKS